MFEKMINFFKGLQKKDKQETGSKDAAKERLHLVLMQDRANVSADFLELMKQEIIEVIKKYIEIDEKAIDVRLTNKANDDGTTGAPALYANIPIMNIKHEMNKKQEVNVGAINAHPEEDKKEEESKEDKKDKEKEEDNKSENRNEAVEESSTFTEKNEKTENVEKQEENKKPEVEEKVEEKETAEISKE